MKVLVTGANGYLGQGIVKALLDKGIDVIAIDTNLERVDNRAKKITYNLFDITGHPDLFFDKPDILLHLAWRDGFVHYSDAHIDDLPKHYHFIKLFAESDIKKIVVMGSVHEIGFYEGSVNEHTPCNPTTPYGISKNALRELTEMLCIKNNKLFQWLRGFYIVGNSRYGSSIFSKIVSAAEEGKTEFPFTKGLNQFDFVDYDVFCEQTTRVILQDTVLGVINICSGRPEKLAERVERFIEENGYKINLKYGAYPDRPYDSKAIWGDNYKLEKIIRE